MRFLFVIAALLLAGPALAQASLAPAPTFRAPTNDNQAANKAYVDGLVSRTRAGRALREFCSDAQLASDATACWGSAIAALCASASGSTGGGILHLPAGEIRVSGTIAIPCSFVSIEGQGPQSTLVTFTGANGDMFTVGVAGTPTRSQSISGLYASGTNRPAGTPAVRVSWTYNTLFERLALENVPRGFDIGPQNNGTVIRTSVIIPNLPTSDIGIYWHAANDCSERSDVLDLHNVVIEGQWSNATGVKWEGYANTLVTAGLRVLHLKRGMEIGAPGGSPSCFPSFLNAFDMEFEGFKERALWIRAGTDFKILGSDLNNLSTGEPNQGNADLETIRIEGDVGASFVRGVSISGSRIGGTQRSGISSDSRDLQLANLIFYTTSLAGTGAYPAINLGPNTLDAQLVNIRGEQFGGAARASHVVKIAAGAKRVQLANISGTYVSQDAISSAAAADEVTAVNVVRPNGTSVVLPRLSVGTGAPEAAGVLGDMRQDGNGATRLQIRNGSVGAAVSAGLTLATGTPNSYCGMGLEDRNGGPVMNEACGPAIVAMSRQAPSHLFYSSAGTLLFAVGSLLPAYANDNAAATGGLPVGGYYQNTTSGAVSQRRS